MGEEYIKLDEEEKKLLDEYEASEWQPVEMDIEPSFDDPVRLEGRYEVDPVPGGKRFQGSWLVLDDGSRYVIAYRPVAAHFAFIDKRVVIHGRPYMPGADTQHMGAQHLQVDTIELAEGETPYTSPPAEPPLPPLARSIADLSPRRGRWVRVVGRLETVEDDPDSYLGLAVLRLADGSQLRARYVPKAAFRRYVGQMVTVISRLDEGDQAPELIGWYAIEGA
jgi:hypothetical protein